MSVVGQGPRAEQSLQHIAEQPLVIVARAMSPVGQSPRPNTSLEPTRSGRQRKPGLRHAVHHLSPGLRRLPPRAAQLER